MSHSAKPTRLQIVPGLRPLPHSLVSMDDAEIGLDQGETGYRLLVLAPVGSIVFNGLEGDMTAPAGYTLLIGPASPRNMAALRNRLAWLRPRFLGLETSVGLGDRLGLATPGHVRAIRAAGGTLAPIFAQQSIREMARTGRSPQQVMDDAAWGMLAEGWYNGFGADADHLKNPADIDACLAAGFTFFTVDPGDHVNNRATTAASSELHASFEHLPWRELEDDPKSLARRYLNYSFTAGTCRIGFDESALWRAAVKYGRAISHVASMYRHLLGRAGEGRFELEVSVDETETPTTHAEHLYIAGELKRLGVKWVSLAPRYIGRFEKGVDYIGDLAAFEADFSIHAAIARQLGPYKLSLHSGSDKFSVYPIAASHTGGLVHLKTAGTSYLEALRTLATQDPSFFRSIYTFARERYEKDRASYHVSAALEKAALPEALTETELPDLLEQFDAREILHVTFGSVLTARKPDGSWEFYDRFMSLLRSHPEAYAANLEAHFLRHVRPFVSSR
jgi:tagaturonate epimerase